jgi:2-C-methyl-D-erythritol 4-phosphate cytidylyltransferase
MQAAAVIAAAGEGLRMGSAIRKQYITLEGIPVLARSLLLFLEEQSIVEAVVVVPPGEIEAVSGLLAAHCSLSKVSFAEGGATRQESIGRGLRAVSGQVDLVCIHDAARPLVSKALLQSLLEAASCWGAAIPVIPLSDTVKEIDRDGFVVSTPLRERLRRVQTPQVFRRSLILEAHEQARKCGLTATDDAALVEMLGQPVRTVPGELSNLKITSPRDLILASLILKGDGER